MKGTLVHDDKLPTTAWSVEPLELSLYLIRTIAEVEGIDDYSLCLRFPQLSLLPLDKDLGLSLQRCRQLPHQRHRHPELVRDFLMC